MPEQALAHISDDLHIAMSVHGEAAADSDLVVVPDNQGTQGGVRGIAVGADREMVFRAQPAQFPLVQ